MTSVCVGHTRQSCCRGYIISDKCRCRHGWQSCLSAAVPVAMVSRLPGQPIKCVSQELLYVCWWWKVISSWAHVWCCGVFWVWLITVNNLHNEHRKLAAAIQNPPIQRQGHSHRRLGHWHRHGVRVRNLIRDIFIVCPAFIHRAQSRNDRLMATNKDTKSETSLGWAGVCGVFGPSAPRSSYNGHKDSLIC